MKLVQGCRLAVRFFLLLLIGWMFTGDIAQAQRRGRGPHLAYAYPAGCERGMSCEITLGGQYLKDADDFFLSGDGVTLEILDWYRPMLRGEFAQLNRKLREAEAKLTAELQGEGGKTPTKADVAQYAGVTEKQLREMEIYRRRDRDPKRQPNEQLDETVRVRLTVDANAKLGKRELRLIDGASISNPLWLHIGRWQEVKESPPSDIVSVVETVDEVVDTLPTVINGQIMPGETDRFAFEARKGMKLVIQVDAREVIPYLADAVPGWFQAVLRLTDEDGREVGYSDSFHFRQDPVMYFEVPRDGRYIIEIRDSLYRGREDFVYRLTVGEIPFVTGIFPLGAPVDSDQTIQVRGWNLTNNRFSVSTMARKRFRPTMHCRMAQSGGIGVHFPLQVGLWPEVFDSEPNNTQSEAQTISMPVTVNGRINYPGDEDVYRIEGGGRLVAEVFARRLGSPLDSMLRLTDADGNEVAFNDDYEDLTLALQTHHADSHLSATLSGGRAHYLHINNAQYDGGSEFTYRLSLHRPRPSYTLRVTPSNLIVKAGQVVPIDVFVMRQDGFDEDIEVSLVEPPDGFRIDGNVIPKGKDHIAMTLAVSSSVKAAKRKEPFQLEMQGESGGKRRGGAMVRPAIPAENMMQAFIWHHLVPVENWNVVVDGKRGGNMPFSIPNGVVKATLSLKKKTYLPIVPSSKNFDPEVIFVDVEDPLDALQATIIQTNTGGFAIELDVDKESAAEEKQLQPRERGNLLMSVYKEITAKPTEENPNPKPRRINYGYLPAIPFEVLAGK
ncbi:peptidase [Rhodopirellula sallentina]|uniref:Peptidase domain-containing protein n=1 Tax=Rhodopirellula sallentina SM41 TaxID=1263870 RepID=M5U385_9BACT|nr:peptidase [Rhodopirellula sallentina]EMI52321.1 peptidase domain-containing protein [Rhodopirellula sallentina SM41]